MIDTLVGYVRSGDNRTRPKEVGMERLRQHRTAYSGGLGNDPR